MGNLQLPLLLSTIQKALWATTGALPSRYAPLGMTLLNFQFFFFTEKCLLRPAYDMNHLGVTPSC